MIKGEIMGINSVLKREGIEEIEPLDTLTVNKIAKVLFFCQSCFGFLSGQTLRMLTDTSNLVEAKGITVESVFAVCSREENRIKPNCVVKDIKIRCKGFSCKKNSNTVVL